MIIQTLWSSRYDCGIFALKYMEYWNGATLTQAVVQVKAGLHPDLIFSSNFSNTWKSIVMFCVGQNACLQIEIGCDISP